MTLEDIDRTYEKLKKDAESAGYHLNADVAFVKDLIEGILTNGERYGYWACPCRLASGDKEKDLDMICPCDYRDSDLEEFGVCYCALYVSNEVLAGQKEVSSIPDKRPAALLVKKERKKRAIDSAELSYPIWRCKVCGYLCAREEPPGVCPICKVKKDRFERFI
jgi:ferredoxin-thioredoxin reductase catalytic subunit